MSVYTQLKEWQRIPHARREWKTYRERLTAFITAHTRAGASAAVLGAGECNDLDLSVLCGHFGRVLLVDADESALSAARESYGRAAQDADILVRDFLGITPKQYEEFAETLQQTVRLRGKYTDIRELAAAARKKLDEMYAKAFEKELRLVDVPCDYVIAAGVHSQLNNMAPCIWSAYEQALSQRAPEMYPYFAAQNDRAVHRFDKAALSAARVGVIYACEKTRLGIAGSVQGAAQAMADIAQLVRRGVLENKAQETLLWNFDTAQAIAYEMQVIAVKKI